MALQHPQDRVSSARYSDRAAPKGGIHPSICLVSGFGVIVAAALLVHAAFRVVF